MTEYSYSKREWLSVPQWRERHPQIGKNKVYELVRNGTLESLRLGGKILVSSDALDRLSEQQNDTD